MNVIVLAKNIFNSAGYYHSDLLDAISREFNVYFYGPNFPLYNKHDNINEVISKSSFGNKLDAIIVGTNWDNDDLHETTVDPHPNINLKELKSIYKIYFINKEYKKLKQRFEYIKNNNIDLVCSVVKESKNWQIQVGCNTLHMPFAVNLSRFKYHKKKKKYDFGFTGSLHKSYINTRYSVKSWIFNNRYLNKKSNINIFGFKKKNILSPKYDNVNIYWDEFGSKNIFGRSRLPKNNGYAKFLSSFKGFLNTKSAFNIVNTRFYELMASKSIIICPRDADNYDDLLKDGVNCIFFDKPSDLDEIILSKLQDEEYVDRIKNHAYSKILEHTYDARIKKLKKYLSI